MNAKFETSRGWVKGIILNDRFYPQENADYITSLFQIAYSLSAGFEIKDEWVRIELSDPYYGTPEYKLIKSPVS